MSVAHDDHDITVQPDEPDAWETLRQYAIAAGDAMGHDPAMILDDWRVQLRELRNSATLKRDSNVVPINTNRQVEVQAPYVLVPADELDRLPEPVWLLEPFILDKSLNVIIGPSGAGKSFLTLDWSACLGSGFAWYGHASQMTNVVYVAAEGIGGLKKRRDAWKAARSVSTMPGVTFLPRAVNLLDTKSVARLITTLETLDCGLIVIDTMARCMIGGDENTSRDVGLVVDHIDHIRRTVDCSVLLVHHTGWDEQRERGSTALRGASDILLALRPDGTSIKLDSLKAKDSEPFATYKLHLRPVAKSAAIALGSNPAAIGAAELSLLETLPAAFGSDRVATSTLMQASGLPQRTFYRALKSLVDRGYVVQSKDGRSTLNSISQQGKDEITANNCQSLPGQA